MKENAKYGQFKTTQGSSFPMKPEDFVKMYGRNLSPFERDEVLDMGDLVYYYNFGTNLKGEGKYVSE
jgi:hypothetical protein